MSKDLVASNIEPLLTPEEIVYLKHRSSMYGKRSDLNGFITLMLNSITEMKPSTRYKTLEFFILLKINDQPFLTKKQRSRINEYAKNFNYNINKTGATKKGSLKLAIDKFQPIALNSPTTLRALNKAELVEIPKVLEREVVIKDESITLEDILIKRLQLYRSARSRKIEFNLTDEDVKVILERKTCYYTGSRFSNSPNYKKTVDRIDSSLGYVKGNVVACTHGANQMKNIMLENNINGSFVLTITQLKRMVSKLF